MSDKKSGIAVAIVAMAIVVVLSNILVQHPLHARLGRIDLAGILTWGAFSYPLAFLVNDLTNRIYGPKAARRVVYVGFAVAVVLSVFVSAPRVAIASGCGFLAGQLTDIGLFNRLRQTRWWKAPAASSLAGSLVDTVVFFSLAFAPVFFVLGANDTFAAESAPLFGVYPVSAPRWISWALGDFSVKVLIDVLALVPYRVIIGSILPRRQSVA
ncbi:hypothetical protein SAMN05216548_10279 [Faunimonas pinastri]|uniref:Probable queuosine precursor transporter n=1 Tax=Faunimonas pinastri TaxID=1855383 RepID=A0A1H9C893_9HYPH|nr:queuosine precursor transporter [Faunimonas pinastri]SEP97382.1 hypothetical protein SAMN05216548_10279 [Faunimonas pinastri]